MWSDMSLSCYRVFTSKLWEKVDVGDEDTVWDAGKYAHKKPIKTETAQLESGHRIG